MGINGLHNEVKPYCRRVHVERYRGCRLAADGYSWLHKGVYSCALLVAQVCVPWCWRSELAQHARALRSARPQRHIRRRQSGSTLALCTPRVADARGACRRCSPHENAGLGAVGGARPARAVR
jgi:hypothetical protein